MEGIENAFVYRHERAVTRLAELVVRIYCRRKRRYVTTTQTLKNYCWLLYSGFLQFIVRGFVCEFVCGMARHDDAAFKSSTKREGWGQCDTPACLPQRLFRGRSFPI